MSNRLLSIIQARIGSTRLPGKVMAPILGKPMVQHIYDRMRSVDVIDEVVIATSDSKTDDQLAQFCDDFAIPYYRGAEQDVLDRFYHAATAFGGAHIIRITGDCPLVDPKVVNRLITFYLQNEFDYCGVASGAGASGWDVSGRYPDGLDAEILSVEVLNAAWKEATIDLHREHVTPFIWRQPQRFHIGALSPEFHDYSECRWTVDCNEDLELVRWIYEELHPVNINFGMKEVLGLLERHPEKAACNQKLLGKEGYEKFWT